MAHINSSTTVTGGIDSSEKVDQNYFSSYEDLDVHSLMLKDQPRTLAYKKYIEKNPDIFCNKVVMDVGAGTGILSLFAAKAGAKKVYAVEASQLSHLCEAIITQNGFENKITVIHGRVEDAKLPNETKVDVIISEWMGFYLLHESMVNSLIVARNKWLTADGIMVPSTATLYLCPVSMKDHRKENIDFWSNVYGFDFSPVLPSVQQNLLSQPTITEIRSAQCLAKPEMVTHLEMAFAEPEDLQTIRGIFNFDINKNDVMHGFACWFDVKFEGDNPVTLDTGPNCEPTHWKQTVMFLPDPLLVSKNELITCGVVLTQDMDNRRRYDICIELEDSGESDEDVEDDCTTNSNSQPTDEVQQMLLEAATKTHSNT